MYTSLFARIDKSTKASDADLFTSSEIKRYARMEIREENKRSARNGSDDKYYNHIRFAAPRPLK